MEWFLMLLIREASLVMDILNKVNGGPIHTIIL